MRQPFLSFAFIIGTSTACGLAWAADDVKTPTAQQSKMTTCQRDAGEKKLEGKDRQAFVTDCLKAKPPAPAASQTQGQKLGACSKEAASQGLKGDERNQFLSNCSKR
ncbi:MAG: PsiF family protein [Pseudomonadota bacterium]